MSTPELMTKGQLAFDLSPETNFKADDYLVAPHNEQATRKVLSFPSWPAPYLGLNLHAPKGLGKSHLAAVFAERFHAQKITPDQLNSWPDLPDQPVVLEDVTLACHETDLLHLFNRFAAEHKAGLLFISETPLSQMDWQLPDLKSRLRSLATAQIDLPDDAFLALMLERHFNRFQCVVPDSAMRYILARMPRSLHAVKNICSALNALSLAQKKPVSVALARLLFEQQDELPLE
ncbi:MAG: hypothetical protein ACON4F_05305 [Candidatus Puniceispirillaceae bacterium]